MYAVFRKYDLYMNYVSINVQKVVFNEVIQNAKHLKPVILHSFSDKPLDIRHFDIKVDIQNIEAQGTGPKVYIDNVMYDEDALVDLRANVWTSITQEKIQVFDPKLIKKCEAILAVFQLQKALKQ